MERTNSAYRLLRQFVAVSLLIGICYFVGIRDLLVSLKGIRAYYVFWLVVLTFVLIWVSCLKWQLFVQESGHKVSVWRLMRYYTTAYFFNLFMPSVIGGDIARSVQLGQHLKSYKTVFAATIWERYTGYLAMSLIGLTFVILGANATRGVEFAIFTLAVGAIGCGAVLYFPGLCRYALRTVVTVSSYLKIRSVAVRLEKVNNEIVETLSFAHNNLRLLLRALILALCFHVLAVLNTYVSALAIGWDGARFESLCVVVPLILLVSVLPITPSGIGIQEGAFVYFLNLTGATPAQALAVAVVLRVKNIATAIVGGIIWASSKESDTTLLAVQE